MGSAPAPPSFPGRGGPKGSRAGCSGSRSRLTPGGSGDGCGRDPQRAVLGRALAQAPRLLVLDERTAHLDLRYQAETAALLRRLNRERGVTILLVSHDLNLAAEVSDRLLLLGEGRLVRLGTPDEVLEESTLTAVFGCEVTVEKSPTTHRPPVQRG